mgnify:CR=1 FL=1
MRNSIVASGAASAIRCGAALVCPLYLCSSELSAARSAVAVLQHHFTSAPGLAGTSTTLDTSVRSSVTLDLVASEVWAALPTGLRSVVRSIDELRAELALATGRPLLEEVELQLLTYAEGGHYARHVDDGLGTATRAVRRSISMLLYLTPDDWCDDDGGQLRIHVASPSPGACARIHRLRPRLDGSIRVDDLLSEVALDILPAAGTLVLFNSATVPHEVLHTLRQRSVVVGWLLEARGPTAVKSKK